MAIKSIYVRDGDEQLWANAQTACKRTNRSLSVVLTDFLRSWMKSQGLQHPSILAVEKTPTALIEQVRSKLAELEDMVAAQDETS